MKLHQVTLLVKKVYGVLTSIPQKWVDRIARVGLVSKATVYCMVGVMALTATFEIGKLNQVVGRKKAFLLIRELVFGNVLLGLVAVGLALYSFWRFLQTISDTEKEGFSFKGLFYRARFATSGAFYGGLALVAGKLAVGFRSSKSSLRQTLSKAVLEVPLGHLIMVLVAAAIAFGGLYLLYQGISGNYENKIDKAKLKQAGEKVLIKAGRIGYIIRGFIWGVISYMILKSALELKTGKAHNVFQFLEETPYGSLLLAGVGLGLICYGLFVFMHAKFLKARYGF